MTIAKGANPISLSASSGSINYNGTGTFTVSGAQGTLSVSSASTTIATASLSGTTVTMTGKQAGSTTITVSAAGNSYYLSGSKSYSLTVNKIAGTTTVSKTSMTLTYPTTTGTFTASCSGGASPTVSSNATGTATVSISSGTATVTWKAAGSATITVSCAATTNYNASSKTVAVTIAKGTNTLTLSATSGTLTYNASTKTKTFTVSTNTSGGTLSVSSNATGVATAAISGSTVTATYVKAGSATITVSSAATSYYNAASATYALTINCGAGYYSASGACTICGKGTYTSSANTASSCTNVNAGCYADTTGSTTACPKSCSSLGGKLYVNSNAGSDANTDCYFTTTGGKYIAASTDTAQTTCESNYYCPATTLYYPNAGGRNNCPDPTSSTYKESVADMDWLTTACPDATTSNSSVSSVSRQSWGTTGLSAITQCRAIYTVSTPCANFTIESTPYSTSAETYNTDSGSRYTRAAKAGYYLNTIYGSAYCNTSTNYMIYKNAAKCPAGSYCPGGSVPRCDSGTYNDTWGANLCTSLGSFYTTSSAGATAATACSGKTTAGKYIATANSSTQTTCEAGYACPSATVYYGSTGSRSACTGTTYSGSGASSCTACPNSATGYYSWDGDTLHDSVYECYKRVSYTGSYGSGTRICYYTSGSGTSAVYNGNSNAGCDSYSITSCNAGYYLASSGASDCVDVTSGYFSAAGATSRSTCPSGYSGSDGTRAANTNCYVSCSAKTISNGTTTVVNSKEYYTGSAYPVCTYNVNCNAKYGASGNKTSSPACTACGTGTYSAGGASACAACTNKPANSSYTGAAASNACAWACNSGYNQTDDNQCAQFCTAGVTHLKLGNGLSIPLYSSARTSPAINVKFNNSVCYGSLATGRLSGTLNVKMSSGTYHSID